MMESIVDEAKAVDIAGAGPVTPVPTRINSEEEAIEWLKRVGVKHDPVYVTEDRNYFVESKHAVRHSERNNLKIITLNEWTK